MATDHEVMAKSSRIPQFSLRSILTWTAALGVYLALLRWIVSAAYHGHGSGPYIPFRILPDSVAEPLWRGCSTIVETQGFGFGLVVVPVYSLIALLGLVAITVVVPHRPYSISLFFGSLLALFCIASDVGLLATFLAGLLTLIESVARRLSRWHVVGSVLALGIALGFYIVVITAEAVASV